MRSICRKHSLILILLLAFTEPNPIFAQKPPAAHAFNGSYTGENIDRVAFPIGGLGAGMFCIEGTGAISHMAVRNNPDFFNEPVIFGAISIKGHPESARVLEGPVPTWKKYGMYDAARGHPGSDWGLARFKEATFLARFPFAEITLKDNELPLAVSLNAWSPFIPTDADNSSLPVGAVEYTFKNTGKQPTEYTFSYNARNFMAIPSYQAGPTNSIKPFKNGFILSQDGSTSAPEKKGDFAIFIKDATEPITVDHCWFRGGWYDPLSIAWNNIQQGISKPVAPVEADAPGASIFLPFKLLPGQEKKIVIMMAWYVPSTKLRLGQDAEEDKDKTVQDKSLTLPSPFHKPWYSHPFKSIDSVAAYWSSNYTRLRENSNLFKNAFYNTTLPPEVVEAVAANVAILKTTTVLRQYDGRLWGWEGSHDDRGSCEGSCTHVWNYAQAICHLFPSLERSLRETEFGESQDADGRQAFRSALPIRPLAHTFYPAADGQLGGIIKVYREWRISGDSGWLRKMYPKVKKSLDYCISTWDPRHAGIIDEPHHNTYDIELWGPEPLCTGIYLGALESIIKMGSSLGEEITQYQDLYTKGRAYMESNLFNGEYFYQKIQVKGLNSQNPVEAAKSSLGGAYSPEAMQLLEKEGPKYQYGTGCLSDGVLGAWLAKACGLETPFDSAKTTSHLLSVYKYNFKKDLSDHSNPQRPTYALGKEGGLMLCTWPKRGQLSLPFVYSNEVWTGIEYQVASHLIMMGKLKEGLDIVQTCRKRYDGTIRNPFDEYECGHWYARAMSSYALLESLTGLRYDAVEKTLYVHSRIGNFKSFLSTETGFGTVTLLNGKVTIETVYGQIPVKKIIVN